MHTYKELLLQLRNNARAFTIVCSVQLSDLRDRLIMQIARSCSVILRVSARYRGEVLG